MPAVFVVDRELRLTYVKYGGKCRGRTGAGGVKETSGDGSGKGDRDRKMYLGGNYG